MCSVLKKYSEACTKIIKYYPAWPPDNQIKLGDFGTIQDGLYEKKGNIFEDFDFKIKKSEGTGFDTFDFTNGVNFEASLKPSVKIPETFEASIKIAFGDVTNVFFSFNECQSSTVDNYLDLKKKIIELYYAKEWKKGYHIVMGLLAAKRSTIILADDNKSEIVFEAEVPLVANIPIAQLKDGFLNGKISFNDTYSSNISLKIIAKKSMTPLIKLSKLRMRFFSDELDLDSSIDNKLNIFRVKFAQISVDNKWIRFKNEDVEMDLDSSVDNEWISLELEDVTMDLSSSVDKKWNIFRVEDTQIYGNKKWISLVEDVEMDLDSLVDKKWISLVKDAEMDLYSSVDKKWIRVKAEDVKEDEKWNIFTEEDLTVGRVVEEVEEVVKNEKKDEQEKIKELV